MAAGIEGRDGRAQLGQAEGDGIAHRAGLERAGDGGAGMGGGGRAGLAHLHVDDVAPPGLGQTGGLHHIHHDEGIDIAPS